MRISASCALVVEARAAAVAGSALSLGTTERVAASLLRRPDRPAPEVRA